MITNNQLESNDLGLITAMICIGFEPTQIVKKSNVIYYVFVADNLEKYVDDYWHGKLSISAISYYNQLKIVKTTIYGLIGK